MNTAECQHDRKVRVLKALAESREWMTVSQISRAVGPVELINEKGFGELKPDRVTAICQELTDAGTIEAKPKNDEANTGMVYRTTEMRHLDMPPPEPTAVELAAYAIEDAIVETLSRNPWRSVDELHEILAPMPNRYTRGKPVKIGKQTIRKTCEELIDRMVLVRRGWIMEGKKMPPVYAVRGWDKPKGASND